MAHYVITQSMPGYLPESDPYVVSGTLADAIGDIREVVDRVADGIAMGEPEKGELEGWDALIAEIERDRDKACDLDESGVTYYAPDRSLVWEATAYSAEGLAALGYVPGEDFEPADA